MLPYPADSQPYDALLSVRKRLTAPHAHHVLGMFHFLKPHRKMTAVLSIPDCATFDVRTTVHTHMCTPERRIACDLPISPVAPPSGALSQMRNDHGKRSPSATHYSRQLLFIHIQSQSRPIVSQRQRTEDKTQTHTWTRRMCRHAIG